MRARLKSRANPDSYSFEPDPVRYADLIDDRTNAKNTINKMALMSVASLALSPITTYLPVFGLVDYVMTGKVDQSPSGWHSRKVDVLWDLPYYLNETGLSAAPVVYIRDDAPSRSNVDREMLGLSLEVPVGADFSPEFGVSMDWRGGNSDKSIALALSPTGAYLEAEASYALSKRLHATMGVATRSGESLRGEREMPISSTRIHIGFVLALDPKK